MNKSEKKAPSCLECRLQDPFQTTDVPMNIKLYNPLCERIFKFHSLFYFFSQNCRSKPLPSF